MTETEIIYEAIDNLRRDGGIDAHWDEYGGHDLDGKLILLLKYHPPVPLFAEIKQELRPNQIEHLDHLAQNRKPFIVIAARIFPKVKEQLKTHNINYLDAGGNIFVNEDGLYINISGKRHTPAFTSTKGNRAFTKTGLKVIYQFLMDETLVNNTYRSIADMTGTAIGNINNIFSALKTDGYLLQLTKDEYKLVNTRNLLDKWVDAYEQRLKPTLSLGTYRFLNNEDFAKWKNLPIGGQTVWGGESAGNYMTDYLRPEELTLYTEESASDLMKRLRLVPDKGGKVKVFKKFWQHDQAHPQLVHPVLAYADLISKGDRRCSEVANKILNEHLQNKL